MDEPTKLLGKITDEVASLEARVSLGDDLAPKRLKEVVDTWVKQRTSASHAGPAEDRIQQLVAMAPDATPGIASAVRAACAHFYEGTGALNRTTIEIDRNAQPEELVRLLRAGINGLGLCAGAAERAIGPELRAAREFSVGADAFLLMERADVTRDFKARTSETPQ